MGLTNGKRKVISLVFFGFSRTAIKLEITPVIAGSEKTAKGKFYYMRLTTTEIATKLNATDRDAVYGLMKFLVACNLAENCGVRKSSGRGRGESVYSFTDGFEKKVATLLLAAKLTC
jgi:hypothetical protein